jgi:D-glycero-alpha-D-manno-heptose 1-phosphate guanylyltransferase
VHTLPQAVVLAGGLGTRLREVVPDRPKPLAEVDGRPFLAYLVAQLRRDGFRDLVLSTGYGAAAVEQYFGHGTEHGVSITYSREPAPLGTAGALRHALPILSDRRVLVMNGDSFLDIDLARFAAAADGGSAVLALVRVPDVARYGTVDIAGNGAITAFREKAARRGPGIINAGVYVLDREVIEAMPPGRPLSLEQDVFPPLVGHGLTGIEHAAWFVDIGVPEAYAALRDDPSRLPLPVVKARPTC